MFSPWCSLGEHSPRTYRFGLIARKKLAPPEDAACLVEAPPSVVRRDSGEEGAAAGSAGSRREATSTVEAAAKRVSAQGYSRASGSPGCPGGAVYRATRNRARRQHPSAN